MAAHAVVDYPGPAGAHPHWVASAGIHLHHQLTIITTVLLLVVAVTAVVAWLVTQRPPLTPIEIPSTSVA